MPCYPMGEQQLCSRRSSRNNNKGFTARAEGVEGLGQDVLGLWVSN